MLGWPGAPVCGRRPAVLRRILLHDLRRWGGFMLGQLGFRNGVDQLVHDLHRVQPLGLGGEVARDPVPEDRDGDTADVVQADTVAPVHGRKCLTAPEQELPGPWPTAPVDVLLYEVRRARVARPRSPRQPGGG